MQIYHQGSNNLSQHKTSQIITQFRLLLMATAMNKPALDNKIIQSVIMFLAKHLEKVLLEKLNLELTS
jgi:hypothetical protein